MGVSELVIIDRDTKDVRRWVAAGGELAEVAGDEDGWHQLLALPLALRGHGGVLPARRGGSLQEV